VPPAPAAAGRAWGGVIRPDGFCRRAGARPAAFSPG
jgi:hypothetical protein